MNTQYSREYLQKLLSNGQTGKVLECLFDIINDRVLREELVLISSSYSNLSKWQRLGLLKWDDIIIENNKINYSLTQVIEFFFAKDNQIRNISSFQELDSIKSDLKDLIEVIEKYNSKKNTSTYDSLEGDLEEEQQQLEILFNRFLLATARLNLRIEDEIDREFIKRKLDSKDFRIVLCGNFSNGKSELLNAMIGRKILPSKHKASTGIVSEVRYSDQNVAELKFRSSYDESSLEFVPKIVKDHLKKFPSKPPLQVSLSELETFLLIQNIDRIQGRIPYDRITIGLPIKIFKDNVVFIDTPGLNDIGRDQTAADEILKADAVMFVVNFETVKEGNERIFWEKNVIDKNQDAIFFICNKYDQVDDKSERKEHIDEAYKYYSRMTKFGRRGVFFVSAKEALLGKEIKSEELIDRSRIRELENGFLKLMKSEIPYQKLIKPAKLLTQNITRNQIKANQELDRIDEVNNKIKKIEKRIAKNEENLYYHLNAVLDKEKEFISALERELKNKFDSNFDSIVEELPDWFDSLYIPVPFALRIRSELREIGEDIQYKLKEKIESDFRSSLREILAYQERRYSDFIDSLENDFKEIKSVSMKINDAFTEINGLYEDITKETSLIRNESVFTRLLTPVSIGFDGDNNFRELSYSINELSYRASHEVSWSVNSLVESDPLAKFDIFLFEGEGGDNILAIIFKIIWFLLTKGKYKKIPEELRKRLKEDIPYRLENDKTRISKSFENGLKDIFSNETKLKLAITRIKNSSPAYFSSEREDLRTKNNAVEEIINDYKDLKISTKNISTSLEIFINRNRHVEL